MVEVILRQKPQFVQVTLVALLTLLSSQTLAQVSAQLSASRVAEFQTLELTVTDTGPASSNQPDFSVLWQDFDIGSTSTQRSFNMINNRFTSSRSWRVEITPKRAGRITVPPIPVGSVSTQALVLEVVALSEEERQSINDAIFMETHVSRETQYPQAAIYVTRKILYNHQVRLPPQPNQRGLDIENATVIPLGDMQQFSERRNDVDYNGMAWRYVVFAERSGTITIPSESVTAGVYPNRGRPQARTIVAEEEVVNILPIPTEYPADQPWFPASQVELSQSLNPNDRSGLEKGEALSRSIELKAQDSYESALPLFDPSEAIGLRVYPEQLTKETQLEDQTVSGVQNQNVNYIVADGTRAVIPPLEITWWDIESKSVQVALLAGKELDLAMADIDSQLSDAVSQSGTPLDGVGQNSFNTNGALLRNPWFWIVLCLAIAGWYFPISTYVKNKRTQRESDLNTPDTVSKLRRGLTAALAAQDFVKVRGLILNFIARELDTNLPTARDLIRSDSNLDAQLTELDSNLYGSNNEEVEMNVEEVTRLVKQLIDSEQLKDSRFTLDSVLN